MASATTSSTALREKYEPVIGLEVHVQLLTVSKIFCACSTKFGAPPNTNVCPVCLGLPGALPVLNKKAVEYAVLAAMALGCEIRETSIFARKNYFYPDLPKGYQISQYDKPLAEHGGIELESGKRIGITRVHLEEDAGKSLHEGFRDSAERSYIDLNRSGVPLIEIVSEPDIRTPEEAYEYLTLLKEIILYTGVSDCNMEEGSLRCDANVSIRLRGKKEFGTKVEVKNVNSFRFIKQALEYEIERHMEVVESGGRIAQETRLYNSAEGKTYGMRYKEQAHDYRYFPEPDLLPLVVDAAWQAQIRSTMPELPQARRARMMAEYGITKQDAHTLTLTSALADQFEAAAKAAKNPKRVANLVQSELMGRLKARNLEIEQSPISMQGVAMSADLVESGAISGKMLKDLYDLCFERDQDFGAVYEKEKPQQITDTAAIEKIIDEVIAASPKQLEQYRAGKTTVKGFFVGQVMKLSKGQANPALVNELLEKRLARKVYFDTSALREIGRALETASLPNDLRESLVVSPLSAYEVLSQLSIANAEEVLRQIHAMYNWLKPEKAALLPLPHHFLATVGFGKPLPDDDFTPRMENAFNACLRATSAASVRAGAGELKDLVDQMKIGTAREFGRLLEAARKEAPKGDWFAEPWFQGMARRSGADPKSRSVAGLVATFNAYYEFERVKLDEALQNSNYNVEKHQNDLFDGNQLIYLSVPELYFLTCDTGFNKVKKSTQFSQIIIVRPEDISDVHKIEELLRKVTKLPTST